MQDKIEITPEHQAALNAKAEQSTPGPREVVDIPTDIATYYDIYAADDWMVIDCDKYGKDAAFIAAANPAVVLALIDKIERLEEDFEAAARSAADESVKAVKLEEEADWLANKLAEASGSMFDDEMEDLGFECPYECKQPGCTLNCRKRNWRESARKAVAEANNA